MNYYRHLVTGASVFGLLLCTSVSVSAQTNTTNIDSPNNANSTANPVVDLNQNGSLVNTQVNTFPLGRTVVGNGVADCSSDGIALNAFGNGIGPFDTGSIGGSFTYTHSFGVDTCRAYAKNQLAKSKLETCLLLISNYSKMIKSGVKISYEDLKQLAGVDCPAVSISKPGQNPFSAAPNPAINARNNQQQRQNQAAFQQQQQPNQAAFQQQRQFPPQQQRQQQAAPQQQRQQQQQRVAPQPSARPATALNPNTAQNQRIQAWQ